MSIDEVLEQMQTGHSGWHMPEIPSITLGDGGKGWVHDQLWLHSEQETSLGYMSCCFMPLLPPTEKLQQRDKFNQWVVTGSRIISPLWGRRVVYWLRRDINNLC